MKRVSRTSPRSVDEGDVATGGGYLTANDLVAVNSHPHPVAFENQGEAPTAWRVTIYNPTDIGFTAAAYVVCFDRTP